MRLPRTTIEDREAVDRYGQVTPELSRDQYRDAAANAFGKLSGGACRVLALAAHARNRAGRFGPGL